MPSEAGVGCGGVKVDGLSGVDGGSATVCSASLSPLVV